MHQWSSCYRSKTHRTSAPNGQFRRFSVVVVLGSPAGLHQAAQKAHSKDDRFRHTWAWKIMKTPTAANKWKTTVTYAFRPLWPLLKFLSLCTKASPRHPETRSEALIHLGKRWLTGPGRWLASQGFCFWNQLRKWKHILLQDLYKKAFSDDQRSRVSLPLLACPPCRATSIFRQSPFCRYLADGVRSISPVLTCLNWLGSLTKNDPSNSVLIISHRHLGPKVSTGSDFSRPRWTTWDQKPSKTARLSKVSKAASCTKSVPCRQRRPWAKQTGRSQKRWISQNL